LKSASRILKREADIIGTLTGSSDNGEFSRKTIINNVAPTQAAGGPANYKTIPPNAAFTSSGIKVSVPGRSTVFLVVEKL
jgi:hypothetical protein